MRSLIKWDVIEYIYFWNGVYRVLEPLSSYTHARMRFSRVRYPCAYSQYINIIPVVSLSAEVKNTPTVSPADGKKSPQIEATCLQWVATHDVWGYWCLIIPSLYCTCEIYISFVITWTWLGVRLIRSNQSTGHDNSEHIIPRLHNTNAS